MMLDGRGMLLAGPVLYFLNSCLEVLLNFSQTVDQNSTVRSSAALALH